MRNVLAAAVLCLVLTACADDKAPPAPPCNQQCQDGVALRALRETAKGLYNELPQDQPVGAQDMTVACNVSGEAHVFGQVTSNARLGTIDVNLSYVLEQCRSLERHDDPPENYDMTLTGELQQRGTIAVQPSLSTALIMASEAMTFSGKVYDPPIAYQANDCVIQMAQSGRNLSGTICGRVAGCEL